MSIPRGKKRRFRRSFDTPSRHEDGTEHERPASPAGPLEPAQPPPQAHCQRCQLPLIGEVFSVAVESDQGRKRFHLCQPCVESMNRWLSRPQREAQRPQHAEGARRLRRGEVVDSLVTRRRNKEERDRRRSRKGGVNRQALAIVGSLLTVAFFAIIVGAIVLLANTGTQR